MDRVAIFVDAGYLFAQGSKNLCGTKLTRRSIRLDHDVLIGKLKDSRLNLHRRLLAGDHH